jgi:hypothetical protein
MLIEDALTGDEAKNKRIEYYTWEEEDETESSI